MSKAIVVTSGGMDSTTAVYHAQEQGLKVYCLSFDYGQRHNVELQYAAKIASMTGLLHTTLTLPNWASGTSALTGGVGVPEGHYADETMKQTVVPNRNAIMLNMAVGFAISEEAEAVFTGVHAGDHPVYPDCRPEFISVLNDLVSVANEGFNYPQVHAPFMHWDKSAIAEYGADLGVPYEHTWSCYKGGEVHCGRCSTCLERMEAFHKAELWDPTTYADENLFHTMIEEGKLG